MATLLIIAFAYLFVLVIAEPSQKLNNPIVFSSVSLDDILNERGVQLKLFTPPPNSLPLNRATNDDIFTDGDTNSKTIIVAPINEQQKNKLPRLSQVY